MSQTPLPNPYDAPAAGGRRPARAGSPDRTTGLTVFGLLQILLGLLFLGMALLIPVAVIVTARSLNQPVDVGSALPSMLVYLLLAAALVILGVGSMRAKRWARNLILVLGWAWLVSGIVSLVGLAWLLPRLFREMSELQGIPAGAQGVVVAITVGMGAVFLLFIPGALVLFYRSASVRATFEAHDPEPDWTEACPLTVLTASVWVFVSAVFFLIAPLSVHGTIPFFGTLLSGFPGSILYLVLAGLWGYAAWGLYRQLASSFWILLLSTIVQGASAVLTFLRIDPVAMYERMGYSEDQLAAMRQLAIFSGPQFALWTAVFVVAFLGYLVYLKRYLSS